MFPLSSQNGPHGARVHVKFGRQGETHPRATIGTSLDDGDEDSSAHFGPHSFLFLIHTQSLANSRHSLSLDLNPNPKSSQRIAARIAEREREASEMEAENAASLAAEQDALTAKNKTKFSGSRPGSAAAGNANDKPKDKLSAKVPVSKSKSQGVGLKSVNKNGVDDLVFEARRRLEVIASASTSDVQFVKSELNRREYRRRADDKSRRVALTEMLKDEAAKSIEAKSMIQKGWLDIESFSKNEPLRLRDLLAEIRKMCDTQIEQKNAAAEELVKEGERAEGVYNDSLGVQKSDIDELLRQMYIRTKEQTHSCQVELSELEHELELRRSNLLEKNRKEMEGFFEKRENAERLFSGKTALDAEKYATELDKRRQDDAEEFAILKTRLETDVANLEQHLGAMRAVYQLNAEKLEYNYRVLVEREAENQSTSAQQRKKIATAREKLMVLKQKFAEQEKRFTDENVKLANEHQKQVETFKELQMKHKRFVAGDTKKYQEVWAMHEQLVAGKVRRVLDADRVIHEQQLGWRWRPPSEDVFLKPDDLALIEGRKKRAAAAAAAAKAAQEAAEQAGEEDDSDPDDDKNPLMGTSGASGPSIADSEENPFSKRLTDPAYTELLQITAEACAFLVDPVTQRAVDEAEMVAQESGDSENIAATFAAIEKLKAESILKALGVRDAPSFDSYVAAVTAVSSDDDDEFDEEDEEDKLRRTQAANDGGVYVPQFRKILPRLIAFAEAEKGASAGGRALAALKAANAAKDDDGSDEGDGSDGKTSKPKPRKTRAELEAAFWQRQADAVGKKPTNAWRSLERGLEKYLQTLLKRKDTLEEAYSLQAQNSELRGLLRQYLGSEVNDELLVPPSALI